jgi:nucleoside-diphosphate-sugar epimerase
MAEYTEKMTGNDLWQNQLMQLEPSDDVLREDLMRIADTAFIDWEKLKEKTILITGATGLIGGILARSLVVAGLKRGLSLRVLALARNRAKAEGIFREYLPYGLEIVTGDIMTLPQIEGAVDYIVHGASVTASKDFVDRPVETIWTALEGTRNLLELAKEKQVKSMVYLSSMEAYGVVDPEHYIVQEKDYGYIDPLQVRSSYSEGKRMAEGLCGAYAHEYQVPVKTVRLAQTFGAGIPKGENRVFAQFARSIMTGTDIVLHTDGSKAHCYCYTSDAVLGLLTVLLRGEAAQAYNISNEATFGTIREMAEMLIERHPQSGCSLVFDIPEDANKFGYAPSSRMLVDASKLRSLGWEPQVDLPEMFERLMKSMSR